jgi:hypothetical protein
MKKTSFKSIREFKEFVYEPGEGHFFFLCEMHRNLLERKQDAATETQQKKLPLCDWPTCSLKATYEFFPNLVTAIKNVKRSELITLDEWAKKRKR